MTDTTLATATTEAPAAQPQLLSPDESAQGLYTDLKSAGYTSADCRDIFNGLRRLLRDDLTAEVADLNKLIDAL